MREAQILSKSRHDATYVPYPTRRGTSRGPRVQDAQHIRVALVTGRSPSGTDGPSPLLGPSVHFSPTDHALTREGELRWPPRHDPGRPRDDRRTESRMARRARQVAGAAGTVAGTVAGMAGDVGARLPMRRMKRLASSARAPTSAQARRRAFRRFRGRAARRWRQPDPRARPRCPCRADRRDAPGTHGRVAGIVQGA